MKRSNQPNHLDDHRHDPLHRWIGVSVFTCLLLGSACADDASALSGDTEAPDDDDDDDQDDDDQNDDDQDDDDQDDDDDDDPTQGSGSEYDQWVEAYCSHIGDCCGEVMTFGSEEDCIAALRSPQQFDPPPGVVYHPECDQRHADAIEALPMCGGDLFELLAIGLSCDACARFTGTLATGDSCQVASNACGEGDLCMPSSDGVNRCTPHCSVPVGQPCFVDLECEAGNYCIEGLCNPPGSVGDVCDLAIGCEAPAVCAWTNDENGVSNGNRCVAPTSPGEPCGWFECGDGEQCRAECGADAWCRQEAGSDGRVCVPLPRLGEPCDDLPCYESNCSSDGVCIPELCGY